MSFWAGSLLYDVCADHGESSVLNSCSEILAMSTYTAIMGRASARRILGRFGADVGLNPDPQNTGHPFGTAI